jgi:dipeptidyl aminopeptidase/acylaminoacyl peptidase
VYRQAGLGEGGNSELRRFGPTGQSLGVIGPPARYGIVRVMRDGTRLTVDRHDGGDPPHLHVVDIARGVFTRLNPDASQDMSAAPRGDHVIAYSYHPDDESRTGIPGRDIYLRPASGVGDPVPLVASDRMKHANDWSPDDQFLLYVEHVPGRAQDLMLARRDGGSPVVFLSTETDESNAQFSPDGKWVVYQSNEAGQADIYVRDFVADQTPAHGLQKIKISAAGGRNPRWHGGSIYFLQGTSLMRVTVQPGTPFQVSAAQLVMELRPSGLFPYDVLPDGGFIVNSVVETAVQSAPPMPVVLNWRSWLKK